MTLDHPIGTCRMCGTRLEVVVSPRRFVLADGVVTGLNRPLPLRHPAWSMPPQIEYEWCPKCHSAWKCACDICEAFRALKEMGETL